MHRLVPRAILCALAGAVFLTLFAALPADAAVSERVKLSIPDPGQLAAVRLQFKVEGAKSPKLKLKLKNARSLPDEVIAAAQMTRSTAKRGRAVALLAIGNVAPPAPGRKAARVTGDSALVDVRPAGTGANITDIELQGVPGSRSFLSVLGLEPAVERQQAQETFGISDSQVPDDEFGRFDIDEFLDLVDVNRVKETKIITRSTLQEDLEDLYREWGTASAIAAAIGPPAVLDAELYGFVTGQVPPFVFQSASGPSQSNSALYFTQVDFTLPVMGAQLSQASELDLLDTPDARCQNGFFDEGTFTRGKGPLLTFNLTYRLDCDVPRDSPTVFADVPLEGAPPPAIDLFKFMPFPYYGSDDIGEAVGGEQTTVVVRSP